MAIVYPAIMGLAISVGYLLSRRSQRDLAISSGQRMGIALGAFCGAMIGAKLPFALSDFDAFLQGTTWFSNGKTILTGLVGGYFGVVIAKWSMDIRTRTGDTFVVPVAAAIAIGRWSCFAAGCCYGQPTNLPWGVVFTTADEQLRHPTQIYESLFHAVCALVFLHLVQRRVFVGNLSKLYIISYCAYRFASEFVRPEVRITGGLTGYQLAAIVIAGLFAWLWWRDRSTSGNQHADPD